MNLQRWWRVERSLTKLLAFFAFLALLALLGVGGPEDMPGTNPIIHWTDRALNFFRSIFD